MKKKAKKLTPLQQLQVDKANVSMLCKEEERKLNESWHEVKENSGSLLLSGITYMFFPRTYKKQVSKDQGIIGSLVNNLPYYLSVARESLTIGWTIMRPFYLKWLNRKQKNCSED
ncbi:hypothetical protein LJC12_06120 [Odoribacter sp. OttesenSCG-928-J03]|nr:hypothetical protein [Odoribacter sp. OttesenSCG-928-J03]MDL2283317.1 hypothetical protein [Odoribacter sp. OttesenSCG-928-G04]